LELNITPITSNTPNTSNNTPNTTVPDIPTEYRVEYNIPRHHVGSIIGYKGKNLQALQVEFTCRLHIEKEIQGSVYRKLIIIASSMNNMNSIKDRIILLMSPTEHNTTSATTGTTGTVTGSGSGGNNSNNDTNDNDSDTHENSDSKRVRNE